MGAPSAIQSIVTLNIPNTSTLDLLLAGLLDNTTGGPYTVNGTFESVTSQVEFLGLVPTVMYAIPNATEPSDGLWGPPTAQAPAAPSSGLFGAFWNAVTSFVTNPLGTVESLVDTVWDVAEAATVYFDHLATEAAALAAEPLERTAAELVDVGKAIIEGLDAVLGYVLSLVKAALAAVVDPIIRAAQDFDSANAAAGNRTIEDVQVNGTVSQKDGLAWVHSFDSVALLGAGLGIAIVVALTLLLPLDLGAATVISVLLSVVPAFAHIALLAGAGPITSLSSQAVLNFGGYFSSISTSTWQAIAGSIAIGASSADIVLAFIAVLLNGHGSVGAGAAVAVVITMIIDLVVLDITIINWALSLETLLATALVFAAIGLGTAALLSNLVDDQLGETYSEVAILLAGVGFGAALEDYHLHSG